MSLELLKICSVLLSVFSVACVDVPPVVSPKFMNDQCFVKGLREPWDADVNGIIVRKGRNKYLVLYASEADRRALTKTGWEEDIRSFDSKYIPTPCPDSWMKDRNR